MDFFEFLSAGEVREDYVFEVAIRDIECERNEHANDRTHTSLNGWHCWGEEV